MEYILHAKYFMGLARIKQQHKTPTVKILMFDHRVSCCTHGDILFVSERQLIIFFMFGSH